MARWFLFVISPLLLVPQAALAQADPCRGALEALNRVKEQITPRVSSVRSARRIDPGSVWR
jgi:hypothetical protein